MIEENADMPHGGMIDNAAPETRPASNGSAPMVSTHHGGGRTAGLKKQIDTKARQRAEKVAEFHKALERLARLPQPVAYGEIARLGLAAGGHNSLHRVTKQIPWLRVETVYSGQKSRPDYHVVIDYQLKRTCDDRAALVNGESAREILQRLHREIKQKKEACNLRKQRGMWVHDNVIKSELLGILEWIEDELNQYNRANPQ